MLQQEGGSDGYIYIYSCGDPEFQGVGTTTDFELIAGAGSASFRYFHGVGLGSARGHHRMGQEYGSIQGTQWGDSKRPDEISREGGLRKVTWFPLCRYMLGLYPLEPFMSR